MITVVYGCFSCAGEEEPYYTCTIFYRDQDSKPHMHWLCRSCVRRLGHQKLAQGLTQENMHPDAQATFDGCSPSREVEAITQGLAAERKTTKSQPTPQGAQCSHAQTRLKETSTRDLRPLPGTSGPLPPVRRTQRGGDPEAGPQRSRQMNDTRQERTALAGRVHVDAMAQAIDDAAQRAGGCMTLDLAAYSGLAPAAFDQLVSACREALYDAGKTSAVISLHNVPIALRKMHHRIAARHGRSVQNEPDGAWRLDPR